MTPDDPAMSPGTSMPRRPASETRDNPAESGLDPINQNVEAILAFYTREEQKISRPQRVLETISGFVGRPVFLVSSLVFVALWIAANVFAPRFGFAVFDPPPFAWLQGIFSLGALLTTTVVLIRQNRLGKLEELRAHLDLQVNLLAEQKATKLIDLIEELRRDLPMVKDRSDPEAAVLQQPTDPNVVLATLDERREKEEPR